MDDVLVVESTIIHVLETPAAQGPPGRDGTASGYTHTQAIAAAIWTVAHNLGRQPSVSVTDSLGALIYPDVTHVDLNLTRINHGSAMTGAAYFI